MKDKTCIYTCITGDYDFLRDVNQENDFDYICFTNNPTLKSNTWKIIPIENEGLDNIRLARKIKILGHQYIYDNYDCSIWIDGATRISGSIHDFIEQECSKDTLLSVFKHSLRNNVNDEALACVYNRRANHEEVVKQMNYIKEQGFLDDNGLVESTVYFKRHNDPLVKKTMEYWFDMILNFTTRDQLGFNFAIYKSGIPVHWIDKNVFFNEWFSWENHASKRDFKNARIYFGYPTDLESMIFKDTTLMYQNGVYTLELEVDHECDKILIHLGQAPLSKFKMIDTDILEPYELNYNCVNQVADYLILDNELLVIEINKEFEIGNKIRLEFSVEELSNNDILNVFKQVYYDKQYQQSLFDDLKKDNLAKEQYINNLEALALELKEIKESRGWRIFDKLRKIKK